VKYVGKTGLTEPCVVTLPFITGKSSISIYFYGPFSIATLDYQRVTGHVVTFLDLFMSHNEM
jgi:hypothetical protein